MIPTCIRDWTANPQSAGHASETDMTDQSITAVFHPAPELITNFARECWQRARRLPITQNWPGQWCDLIVDRSVMLADWEWCSGMRTASEIIEAENIWRVVMAIPFAAFGCQPQPGDVWKANLFRISRFNGERQYLAFSPTFTEKPNYHVSEAFVDLCFTKPA